MTCAILNSLRNEEMGNFFDMVEVHGSTPCGPTTFPPYNSDSCSDSNSLAGNARFPILADNSPKREFTHQNPRKWCGPGVEKPCPVCLQTFLASAYELSRGGAKYCSRACRNRSRKGSRGASRFGSDNPNWKGGISKNDKSRYRLAFQRKYPQKAEAHRLTRNAISRGDLVRSPCRDCGDPNTHAHHTDYSKPLLVVWLCPACHRREHRWQA